MALELPALPFALVESNIFEEVAARAQTEQDVQRSRMLDPEYLVLLGQSVLARHSVHLAVAQGLHPGYIMHDVADQLVESRLARLGRAYFFREDAMVVDVGYNDQIYADAIYMYWGLLAVDDLADDFCLNWLSDVVAWEIYHGF
ncbi:hypothetical protein HWV62_37639 [Athelia sp. TMB]|nr:hypothetical protein HWV62_37639 [Athelia sp. TMB]